MDSPAKPITIVRLALPVMDGQREHSELYLAGKPGGTHLPTVSRGEEVAIDALAVERVIAERSGLNPATVRKLAPIDLVTVMFALFGPVNAPQKRR